MSMPFFYIAILKGIISQSNRYHNDCIYKNCIKFTKYAVTRIYFHILRMSLFKIIHKFVRLNGAF